MTIDRQIIILKYAKELDNYVKGFNGWFIRSLLNEIEIDKNNIDLICVVIRKYLIDQCSKVSHRILHDNDLYLSIDEVVKEWLRFQGVSE